jgi:hypothetical protein
VPKRRIKVPLIKILTAIYPVIKVGVDEAFQALSDDQKISQDEWQELGVAVGLKLASVLTEVLMQANTHLSE